MSFGSSFWARSYSRSIKSSRVKNSLRPNLAERVLTDRHVTSIKQIMHTAEQRIAKQLSTRSAHKVLPFSKNDDTTTQVRLLARRILLQQRARAAASFTDKNGVPVLSPANGVGHFILPLQRVSFTYCSHSGDSRGIREYLSKNLPALATSNPTVEFVIEPRWGRFPQIQAWFLAGHTKQLCVKNMSPAKVHESFLKLRNSSGRPLRRFRQGVDSYAPAIRPLWSPFHMLSGDKNNPLLPFISKVKPSSNQ
jgi:hypothetical protein